MLDCRDVDRRPTLVVDRDLENAVAVIRGGNATIYVSDMQRAVDFYRDTLELPLVFRADDHWAELDAGGGLHLGLHPASARGPAPGTRAGSGSVSRSTNRSPRWWSG
jgi:hypothetical protein